MEEKKANVQDATVGIVAYITLIGFIIAIILNGSKEGEEKKFGAFHLRQALGLIIFSIGAMIVIWILTFLLLAISLKMLFIVSIVTLVVYLGILACLIIGIVNAANKTYKPLPVIGDMINKMLGSTFE